MRSDKRKRVLIMGLIWVVILYIADRVTKIWAVARLKDNTDITIIKNVFVLHYLENRGAAFGMLQGKRLIFVIITIVVAAAIIYIYTFMPVKKRYLPLRIVMIMIFGGAIGNFFDRAIQGYVVDFFYFSLINFPIFNVADIFVTVAAILLILLILLYYKEEDLKDIGEHLKLSGIRS